MDRERKNPEAWAAAERRASILAALPERPGAAAIRGAMRELEAGRATVFRWLKRLREDDRTSALLPHRRGPRSGTRPLAEPVLVIVERHFRELYATRRGPIN